MMSVAIDCLICHVILILTLSNSCIGNNSEINSDYYYGNMVVRSGRVIIECDNKFNKEYCHLKCGNSGYECVNDKCVCAKANKRLSSLLEMRDTKKNSVEQYNPDNVHRWPGEILGHPLLRHHIAHFCPNLEIARQCIRKCTALGKPAFCGKDHVCYCSHKTTHKQNQDLINATDVYTQFKDMYLKYFGPGIFNEKPTTSKPEEPKGWKGGKGGKEGKGEKGDKEGDMKKKEIDETDENDNDEGEESGEDKGDKAGKKKKETDDPDENDDDKGKEGGEDEEESKGNKSKDEKETKDGDTTEGDEGAEEGEKEEKEGRRKIFIFQY